jgi:hypothetical protein
MVLDLRSTGVGTWAAMATVLGRQSTNNSGGTSAATASVLEQIWRQYLSSNGSSTGPTINQQWRRYLITSGGGTSAAMAMVLGQQSINNGGGTWAAMAAINQQWRKSWRYNGGVGWNYQSNLAKGKVWSEKNTGQMRIMAVIKFDSAICL